MKSATAASPASASVAPAVLPTRARRRCGPWLTFAQHECLQLVGPCYGGDHIVAAMNLDRCPGCGKPCTLNHRDTWARVIRRRVSDAVWHRPSTWRRWHWEYRLRGHLEEVGYDYRKHLRNAAAS